jgi:hypothetical protein
MAIIKITVIDKFILNQYVTEKVRQAASNTLMYPITPLLEQRKAAHPSSGSGRTALLGATQWVSCPFTLSSPRSGRG